jgi:hypothetical protein
MMGERLALFMEHSDNSAVYRVNMKKGSTLSFHKMLHSDFSTELLKKELWIILWPKRKDILWPHIQTNCTTLLFLMGLGFELRALLLQSRLYTV